MRKEPSEIIKSLKANGGKIRETARQVSVSPGTVINWRRRASSSVTGLRYLATSVKRKSTRPKSLRTTTLSAETQDQIVRLKKETGFGAKKLKVLLGLQTHHSTIHRFLKSKELTIPGKNYRRPRYQETTHMYVKNALVPGKLQMDVKYVTPELSGLVHTAYLYAVMDIWSRYKQGVILPLLDQRLAIEALRQINPGLPFEADFVQTDNGLEFQKAFTDFVKNELGWEHHHIHKSSPNENAVIERSFRTDEEEFFWRLKEKPRDLIDLNAKYQEYLRYYNEYRPHLGIELKTPLQKLQSVQ
jgi:transposase InsO family protein